MRSTSSGVVAAFVVLAGCHDVPAPVDPAASPDLASFGSRDRTPPTIPTDLRVTNATSHSVSLAWNPSTDKSSFSHRVRLTKGFMVEVPSTQTTFTWGTYSTDLQHPANLEPQQTYSFFVSAIDAAGNESKFSNMVTATTPPDVTAPTAPAFTLTDVAATYATVG